MVQILFLILVAALGLAVGSFLNVVIYRIPQGQSLVRPGSGCPACGASIRAVDNVPLLSWLVLRGRCRNCGSRISLRYPIVEVLNAGLWVVCALRFGEIERASFAAISISVLIALSVIDLEHRRLPNAIVLPATAVVLIWLAIVSAASGNGNILGTAAASGAAAFMLLFVIAVLSRGMGFGDVKLAALIGLVAGRFGWEVAVGAVFGAFIIGGLAAVILLLTRRKGRKESIPFGPALAGGATLALLLGPTPVRTWLGL